jgi:hypothetical protein
MTVSVKARIFDDGSIKIDSDEDVKEKLIPLRGCNVVITFEEEI